MTTHLGAFLRFDDAGRTALADDDQRLRALVEQVLFTSPGERVGRPDFGCGLSALVWDGGEALVAAAQMLAQAGLQRWLGDRIDVERVTVAIDGPVLRVSVQYAVRRSHRRVVAAFTREGAGP